MAIFSDAGAQVPRQEAGVAGRRRRPVGALLDAELLGTGPKALLGHRGLAEGTALGHATRGRCRGDADGFIGPDVLQPGEEPLRGGDAGGDVEPQGVQ